MVSPSNTPWLCLVDTPSGVVCRNRRHLNVLPDNHSVSEISRQITRSQTGVLPGVIVNTPLQGLYGIYNARVHAVTTYRLCPHAVCGYTRVHSDSIQPLSGCVNCHNVVTAVQECCLTRPAASGPVVVSYTSRQ